ncbi:MAG: SPOR domain-containing protein [Azoarcus sp.]|nr:SPOR domain-containing protein [Azoarcus sp.]
MLALLGSGGEPSRPAATNADGGKGRVYVQVGAFSDAGRADALVNELKKQGFAAYAEQAGKVNRVRIGPLSKSESTRTVARLKAKGRKAVVVSR